MNRAMATAGIIGTVALGTLSAVTTLGTTEPAAVPGGAMLGSTGGSIVGLFTCAKSNGPSEGGGSASSTTTPKPWKITNPAATKVVGGRAYLKDAKTGLWWSPDTAGHGGSAWKVYTEGKGGVLKWFRDADIQGNFIDPALKWKSPVGQTIR